MYKKYIDLIFCYIKINFAAMEVYDKDFIFGIIAMLVNYAAGILSLFFIFEFVHEINGWTLQQVLFLYGLNLTGYSLWSCFFINTITLPYYIRNGEFDKFLLRPVEPIFQIMMDGFDDDSWGELIVGVIVFAYSWISLKIPAIYALFIPVVAVSGCLVYAGMSIALSTVSFFTIAQADVANLTNQIKELAQYPISIYPKVIRIIFTFLCPVAFIAFIPSLVVFRMVTVWAIIAIPLVSLIFFLLSIRIWMIGVKHYGGTGT
jgi:ABC-2 type transport system permease protein